MGCLLYGRPDDCFRLNAKLAAITATPVLCLQTTDKQQCRQDSSQTCSTIFLTNTLLCLQDETGWRRKVHVTSLSLMHTHTRPANGLSYVTHGITSWTEGQINCSLKYRGSSDLFRLPTFEALHQAVTVGQNGTNCTRCVGARRVFCFRHGGALQ
jgi:hypothetical protein